LRHRNKSGSTLDPESDSLLLKKAFTSPLSKYLPPSCKKHEMKSLQFEIDELIDVGQLNKLKHVFTKANQMDTLYHKRWEKAKSEGRTVGAAGY
jgi:hypothetical protein